MLAIDFVWSATAWTDCKASQALSLMMLERWYYIRPRFNLDRLHASQVLRCLILKHFVLYYYCSTIRSHSQASWALLQSTATPPFTLMKLKTKPLDLRGRSASIYGIQMMSVTNVMFDRSTGLSFRKRSKALTEELGSTWGMVLEVSDNLPPATLRWRIQNWLTAGEEVVERGLGGMKVGHGAFKLCTTVYTMPYLALLYSIRYIIYFTALYILYHYCGERKIPPWRRLVFCVHLSYRLIISTVIFCESVFRRNRYAPYCAVNDVQCFR